MIHVTCSSCGKQYKLPDNAAGRKARCKACNTAMVVPDAPDDLFDDSTSAGDDLTALYANKEDTSSVVEPASAEGDPLAFNPAASFQQSEPLRTPSLPPMKLLIGVGAGMLGLIVVVVVVVVVMLSGGDDAAEQARNDSLALNLNTAVPSTGSPDTDAPETPTFEWNQPGNDTPSQPVPDSNPDTGTDPAGSDGTTESPGDDPANEPSDSDEPVADTPLPESPVVGQPATPSLLTPTSSDYGIILPEGLSLISQTRVAIRTAPHEDGTWLSMEVHKLAGLDRRQATALADDGTSVLVRGRRVAVPADAELSDVVSDYFTAKRLLYPKQPGEALRRVAYVIKDGPYLISVLGRYPAGDEARLALLDEAAKSVQPVEGR